jgi:hypothetical protein
MADFCASCVVEMFDVPRHDNDLTTMALSPGAYVWVGCEGCGLHLFDRFGERRCGNSVESPLSPAGGLDPCPTCRTFYLADETTGGPLGR